MGSETELDGLLALMPPSDLAQPGALFPLSMVFALFLVTLGPVDAWPEMVRAARGRDPADVRGIALRATLAATLTLVAGGLVGRELLAAWKISTPVIVLAGGLILLLCASRRMLAQRAHATLAIDAREEKVARAVRYASNGASLRCVEGPPTRGEARQAASEPPSLVTPYGLAAVVALLVEGGDAERTLGVLAVLALVLLLDWIALLHAERFLRWPGSSALSRASAVFAVLQAALAVHMLVSGLALLRADFERRDAAAVDWDGHEPGALALPARAADDAEAPPP